MEIQHINRQDDEKVFLAFRNVDGGGSITANSPVCLAVDGNSVDGNAATQPAAVNLLGWIGIADKTVAINGYGRAQANGFRNSVLISNQGSSITITAGDALVPIAGTDIGLTSGGFNNGKYGIVAETATISGATYAKVQLRTI